jgi:hypothetical protein
VTLTRMCISSSERWLKGTDENNRDVSHDGWRTLSFILPSVIPRPPPPPARTRGLMEIGSAHRYVMSVLPVRIRGFMEIGSVQASDGHLLVFAGHFG